jgi:hypothetical protein
LILNLTDIFTFEDDNEYNLIKVEILSLIVHKLNIFKKNWNRFKTKEIFFKIKSNFDIKKLIINQSILLG